MFEPVHIPAHIFDDSVSVAIQLDVLGLKADWLRSAIEEGISPVLACTLNDPVQLPGILGWGKVTRALRDRLIPRGYTRLTVVGQASTVDPSGKYAIVVAAGDDKTGQRGHVNPANRSPKGLATRLAIQDNQLSFAEVDADFRRFSKVPKVIPLQTWLLLYFIDDVADEVRCELSLPDSIGDDGYVLTWKTRILLPPLDLPNKPAHRIEDDEDDEGVDDFDVTRKTG